jgi:hypothetical protein
MDHMRFVDPFPKQQSVSSSPFEETTKAPLLTRKNRQLHALSEKALEIIQSQPQIRSKPSDLALLTAAIGFGLKGMVFEERVSKAEVEGLHEAYHGLDVNFHLGFRALSASHLLQESAKSVPLTEEERKGLMRIAQHRNRLLHYSNQIEAQGRVLASSPLIKEIMENIDELDHPSPESFGGKVVTLDDGTTTFSLPGGSQGHYVLFEIQKEGNDYFFILHNRGEGMDARLHGTAEFEIKSKNYKRTSVRIKVSKEVLKNPNFFAQLLNAEKSKEMSSLYNLIYKTLIVEGKGQIIKSKAEELLEKLYFLSLVPVKSPEMAESIEEMALNLLNQSESFHSTQAYKTCVESNSTAPEKRMAPPSLQRLLKQFTLSALVERLKGQTLPDVKGDVELTVKYANRKLKDLEGKRDQPAPYPVDLKTLEETIGGMEDKLLRPLLEIDAGAVRDNCALFQQLMEGSIRELEQAHFGKEIDFEKIERLVMRGQWILKALENREDRQAFHELKENIWARMQQLTHLLELAKSETQDQATHMIQQWLSTTIPIWVTAILGSGEAKISDQMAAEGIKQVCNRILQELKQKNEKREPVGFFIKKIVNSCHDFVEKCNQSPKQSKAKSDAIKSFNQLQGQLLLLL